MPAHHTAITGLTTSSGACSSAPVPGTTTTIADTGLATTDGITGVDTTAGDTTATATTVADTVTGMAITADGATDIEAVMTMASAADTEAGTVRTAADTRAVEDTTAATVAGMVMPVVDSMVAADSTVAEAMAADKQRREMPRVVYVADTSSAGASGGASFVSASRCCSVCGTVREYISRPTPSPDSRDAFR